MQVASYVKLLGVPNMQIASLTFELSWEVPQA